MLGELQELKASLNYSQNYIDDVKKQPKAQQSECQSISNEMKELKSGQATNR